MKVILYAVPDCPHCERARWFLEQERIDCEVRYFDPIIENGVKLLTATIIEEKADSQVVEVSKQVGWPILWFASARKVILGWNQGEYEALANFIDRERRSRALDFNPAKVGVTGEAAKPAEAHRVQETAGVPAMPGMVGSNGNVPDGVVAAAHR